MRGGRKDTVRVVARQHAASFWRRRRRRYHAAQHARRLADARATRKTFWLAVLFFAAWALTVCVVR